MIEAVEAMPLDEQEILLDIQQMRLSASRRSQLVQEVAEVRQEYAEGKVKFGSVDDFLADLDDWWKLVGVLNLFVLLNV